MSKLRFVLPAGAALAAAGFAFHASAQEPGAWRAAVTSIQGAGYTAIEELETTSFGGFEAEVFDAQEQSFELQIDSNGAIANRRMEARSSAEERIELAGATRLIDWLEKQGYRELHSISADDGGIEVEAEDAAGKHMELDIVAEGEAFKLLRSERD